MIEDQEAAHGSSQPAIVIAMGHRDIGRAVRLATVQLSRNHDPAKATNCMLRRWDAFTHLIDDGRVCLTNNSAEHALRCVPLDRKAGLYSGSDRGSQRVAILYTLVQTARLNDVD